MLKRLFLQGLLGVSVVFFDMGVKADEAVSQSSDSEGESSEIILNVKAQKKRKISQKTASTSSTEMNRAQIGQLAQGMETSLPRLMATTMPGVVQGAFGQTFIRGNHANIQYQIDGVQLPDSPSNTFGQAISPRNIEKMEVITGGLAAQYGQRLSAVVDISTKSGLEHPEGEVELNYGTYNTFTPHLLYGGSNESGTVHYFFSLNFNRTDRGLDTPQPQSTALGDQSQGGTESVHNRSVGDSEFAKVDWQLDNENKLSWVVFNAFNHYQIPTFPSSFSMTDPYFQPGYTDVFQNSNGAGRPTFNFLPSGTDDTQAERNSFTQLVWKHQFSEQAFFRVAPYYKYSSVDVTNDPANDLYSYGKITGATPSSFAQHRHTNNLGLRTDYTLRADDHHLIKTGLQVQGSRSDGFVSIQTNPALAPLVDSTPNIGFFEGIYLQDDYKIVDSLILSAGLRFDAVQFSFGDLKSNDSLLQPRVGLTYLATPQTQLHVFYGKLFQPAPVENLRYEFDASSGSFNLLNSYDIKAEKDDYYEAGISQQLFGQQILSLNAYYKTGVNILDDGQVLNTSIAQPYNFNTGYAYGAEISVRGQLTEDWSEFVNYSYGIAKGRGRSGDTSGSNDDQFLDHVQPHTMNAGVTWAKNSLWWTLQGLYGSGLRTGPNNSLNLPSHFTMDTTLGYEFHGKDFWSNFKVSGDILNIFDNRYPITIANGYNGSHYSVGRQFFIRFTKSL